MAWAEYGSARGLPCILIPDIGSSRLAPGWLLHDSALPSAIRLLAVDRPGIGVSDPIGFGGTEQPAEDLRRMVETLAVGRVAMVGIGQGADDALAFAARYPALVTSVSAISVRLPDAGTERRGIMHPFARRQPQDLGRARSSSWIQTAGKDADLTQEVSWSRMLDRLDVVSAQVLGDRWRESDFREAVAADAAQINPSWTAPARPGGPAQWVLDPEAVRVPVELWHGKHETGTTLQDTQSFAQDLPLWTVHPAAGARRSWVPGTRSWTTPATRSRVSLTPERPAGAQPVAAGAPAAASTGGNCPVLISSAYQRAESLTVRCNDS